MAQATAGPTGAPGMAQASAGPTGTTYEEWKRKRKKEQEEAAASVRKASSRAWEAGISSPVRELSSYINNSSSLDSGGVDIVHPDRPA